jgi:hypothetical protein
LIEGLLITGDSTLLPLLQTAYTSGPDAKDCAFIQTPHGPMLNNSCELVHHDICKASVELIKIAIQDQERGLVDEVKNKALVKFGCSPTELR